VGKDVFFWCAHMCIFMFGTQLIHIWDVNHIYKRGWVHWGSGTFGAQYVVFKYIGMFICGI